MDVNERSFLFACVFRRLASVTILSLCFAFPQKALCMPVEIESSRKCASTVISDIVSGDSDVATQSFDHLETIAQASDNPLEVSRQFLECFLKELNEKYNLNLTIQEACTLVRENIHLLQLSEAQQTSLMKTIKLFEIDLIHSTEQFKESTTKIGNVSAVINWPWWWIAPVREKKKSRKNKPLPSLILATQPLEIDQELPPNTYIGGAEILAGALTCVIGSVFPPAYALGVGLMMDGTRRVFDDLGDLDKMRCSKDHFSSPTNFDF